MKVSNRKCVRHLGYKTLTASRTRNIIAVMAIALTAILFTALFTIMLSINEGFQQNTFRQVGGYFHGTFKDVTESQMEEFKTDPLIKEAGGRMFLGVASDPPFNKIQVEVSYMDDTCAKAYFIAPEEGHYPREGTDEIITDTRVLSLLGIEPEIGAKVHLPFYIDSNTSAPRLVDRTYTLCGWWTTDEASPASFVNLPRDAAEEIAALSSGKEQSMTGGWSLNVMFSSSFKIEENMEKVLENHGYQNKGQSAGDNFIATGVNWGYTGASMASDPMTILAVTVVLALIIFTGYLIIYNVFQISVANDIRFYGLLKTIGTTGKQLKRIIRMQALILSAVGIPTGLLLGWLAGVKLTPVIVSQLDGVSLVSSANPVIFIGAAAFALFTVLVSCRRPGKMAARVSPVEAVRYVDTENIKKKKRKSTAVSIPSMAWANLGRSRSKTIITVISLSLAVTLMNLTVTFSNGFDMGKYISNFVAADFIVGDANYFQVGGTLWGADYAVPEAVISTVEAQGGVSEGGRTFGKTFSALEFIDEGYYRQQWGRWNSKEVLDEKIALMDRTDDGLLADDVQMYGMEPFCLGKLKVMEGSLSEIYEPGSRSIAAVYASDETGNVDYDSHWARLGDTVTIRYVDKWEFFDPETGEAYPEDANLEILRWGRRAIEYTDVDYKVAAIVAVPNQLGYRFYGSDEFVLNSETMLQDSGTETGSVMYYACDMADSDATENMEAFLSEYTGKVNTDLDFESRASYEDEFKGFQKMFLMLGGALSFIVGLVGVLNFVNAVLTGIITRKRELAMLQSIGMTGKQLKQMLMLEGLLYTVCSLVLCAVLNLLLAPVIRPAIEGMFWFFTYKFTMIPILAVTPVFAVIGILVPLLVLHFIGKATVAERLRETE